MFPELSVGAKFVGPPESSQPERGCDPEDGISIFEKETSPKPELVPDPSGLDGERLNGSDRQPRQLRQVCNHCPPHERVGVSEGRRHGSHVKKRGA